jgi:sterol desaturase/sphingolipid hydroxylase (fatty acid hydroxylase superfamily)
VSSEEINEARPAYERFLLLLLGESIAGIFLYAVFTLMPTVVQIGVTLASWAILSNDRMFPKKTRSLGSLLSAITAVLFVSCGFVWRVTHKDVWSRLMLTGGCLLAGLIFLDRRADD